MRTLCFLLVIGRSLFVVGVGVGVVVVVEVGDFCRLGEDDKGNR